MAALGPAEKTVSAEKRRASSFIVSTVEFAIQALVPLFVDEDMLVIPRAGDEERMGRRGRGVGWLSFAV